MFKKGYRLLFIFLLTLLGGQHLDIVHADTGWTARYWNNRELSGQPDIQRKEASLDYDWGGDAPAEGIDKDKFSARWTRGLDFAEGLYRFIATTDDGMRVYIDNKLVIDSWYDSQVHAVTADVYLSAGWHNIQVDYYEAGGAAVAKLIWVAQPSEPAIIYNWRGEYYNNMTLFYPPARVVDDTAVQFDWGYLAPVDGAVSADNFSVRWTRTVAFTAGTYRFTVRADDGVRLWVNDELVIDAWQDQTESEFTVTVSLPSGDIPIKLEYFENKGKAYVDLSWQSASGTPITPTTADTTLGLLEAKMVNALYLNVRSGPSLDDEPIGFLSLGQIVELTGFRYGAWVQVRLPSGEVGWAGSSFLQLGQPFINLAIWGGSDA